VNVRRSDKERNRHALVVQRLDDALQIATIMRETVDAEDDRFPQRGTSRVITADLFFEDAFALL